MNGTYRTVTPSHPIPPVVSPIPCRAASAAWGSSLAGGLFPPTFDLPPQVPQGIQPFGGAVQTAEGLCQPPLSNNTAITDLAVFPAPSSSDPWHIAHARICAHATQTCAACSVAFVCCSCRALRFTPGTPPLAVPSPPLRRSRSSSPAFFRNVGNGPSPQGFDSMDILPDDDAYMHASAECDTCDNSSCPHGNNEPATWTITVEQFDEGAEEHYDCTFRACGACNRTCKRSFLGFKIKSRVFDSSTRRPLDGMTNEATRHNSSPTSVEAQPQSAQPAPHRALSRTPRGLPLVLPVSMSKSTSPRHLFPPLITLRSWTILSMVSSTPPSLNGPFWIQRTNDISWVGATLLSPHSSCTLGESSLKHRTMVQSKVHQPQAWHGRRHCRCVRHR